MTETTKCQDRGRQSPTFQVLCSAWLHLSQYPGEPRHVHLGVQNQCAKLIDAPLAERQPCRRFWLRAEEGNVLEICPLACVTIQPVLHEEGQRPSRRRQEWCMGIGQERQRQGACSLFQVALTKANSREHHPRTRLPRSHSEAAIKMMSRHLKQHGVLIGRAATCLEHVQGDEGNVEMGGRTRQNVKRGLLSRNGAKRSRPSRRCTCLDQRQCSIARRQYNCCCETRNCQEKQDSTKTQSGGSPNEDYHRSIMKSTRSRLLAQIRSGLPCRRHP